VTDKSEEKYLEKKAYLAMNGDMAALTDIYAAKRRDMYFTARVMLGSKEDAEDAVQDAMLRIFLNIRNLKNPKAINSWIFRVLHNSCVDIIRKQSHAADKVTSPESPLFDIADEDGAVEPETLMSVNETSEELYEAIRALPEKSREALVLHYFGDMKYRDIARMTNTSIKTVSTNLIRAKKNLKNYLYEHYPEMAAMASFSALMPALETGAFAHIAGGTMAAAGAKLKGAALAGKGLATALSNSPGPIAAGAAGVVCVTGIGYAVLANDVPPDYAIALESERCECGHINPEHIELRGARASDNVSGWEVVDADGERVFSGDLAAVTAYVTDMSSKHKDGIYELRCVVTDWRGKSYDISRGIAIGNYSGDSRRELA
jgi:RNA polymerase sigma-70 factor (ECF subfamily)